MKEWTDPDNCLLASSIFGTDHVREVEDLILTWAARHGFDHCRVDTIEISIGAAVTISSPNRQRIVVKVWPGTADVPALAAQMKLQKEMASRNFPAPRVLTELSPLGPGWAIGMEFNRSGVLTDVRLPGVRFAMAAGLARFVALGEAYRNLDGLPRRLVPPEGRIWPPPHNALFDFGATVHGAEWIDDIAQHFLPILRSAKSKVVVGHCDWSAKNMRMGPDGLAMLYDWDSVFIDHEALIVGSAAAQFPVNWELDVPQTPTNGEVAAFIRDYEATRHALFAPRECSEIEASVTYARAYKARCEHALDPDAEWWSGSARESLKNNGPFALP
jgi:hypothetical protein